MADLNPNPKANRSRLWRWNPLPLLLLLLVFLWLAGDLFKGGSHPSTVPYSQFIQYVKENKVEKAVIHSDKITAVLKPGVTTQAAATTAKPGAKEQTTPQAAPSASHGEETSGGKAAQAPPSKAAAGEQIVTTRVPGIQSDELLKLLDAHGVVYSGKASDNPWWLALLYSALFPILLLVGIIWWTRRLAARGGAGAGSALSFGKNRAKIYDASTQERVTFDDVAGIDEVIDELREVVDFLSHPAKYSTLGARIPKGVLLVGSPGTGKTLVARAVAGEAGVPFFTISGSDFVEMFVGVGAARVRDLFEQAKQKAPCIIFIDEIDAIGRSRGGVGAIATHDEREQTLNQLLSEMDGFDSSSGVVIMAATNRPEILDSALVRSGRFDRQVVVDRPDIEGRYGILKVHSRKIRIGPDTDLRTVAKRTPGMVGADLAKVVNEAALAAVRRGSQVVEQRDFEEAVDRIQLGLRKHGHAMGEEEKRRVAYHEAGHSLVALSLEHADPVHRVTIIPRTIGALGATLQLPTEDQYLLTKDELMDRVCVMLGGRASEDVIFGALSTGAENDLERATETARQMVTRFGMSEKVGPQAFGGGRGRFLESAMGFQERNFSEATAQLIDDEVRDLLDGQYVRARRILDDRRAALEAISSALLDKETLEAADLKSIIDRVEGDGATHPEPSPASSPPASAGAPH